MTYSLNILGSRLDSSSLTEQMLQKTYALNTRGALLDRWVVSRFVGSVGTASACLRDAVRELVAVVHAFRHPAQPLSPFSVKRLYATPAESCATHMHHAARHVAGAVIALSFGAIAPTMLMAPAMQKMGFEVKVESTSCLSKTSMKVLASMVGLAGLAAISLAVRCWNKVEILPEPKATHFPSPWVACSLIALPLLACCHPAVHLRLVSTKLILDSLDWNLELGDWYEGYLEAEFDRRVVILSEFLKNLKFSSRTASGHHIFIDGENRRWVLAKELPSEFRLAYKFPIVDKGEGKPVIQESLGMVVMDEEIKAHLSGEVDVDDFQGMYLHPISG